MQIRTTQAGTPLGFPLSMPHKSNLQDTARAAMERHQWEDALRAWLDWWADRPEEASMDDLKRYHKLKQRKAIKNANKFGNVI